MHYNTQQLIEALTGKNRTFIKRVAKHQEEKYGNRDIFSATAGEESAVTISFGDYWIEFYFRDGKVVDTYGNGQGHKYHKSLQACAEELYSKKETKTPKAENWIRFRRDSFATLDDWKELCVMASVDPHDDGIESITIHIDHIDVDAYDE